MKECDRKGISQSEILMKNLFCTQLCEKQKMTSRLQRFILSSWGKRTIGQWFYKYGPQMSSILILWELVRIADSQLTPQNKRIRNHGQVGPAVLFTNSAGDSDYAKV